MQLALCAVSLALMCITVYSQGEDCTRAVEQCQLKYYTEVTTSPVPDAHCVFVQNLMDCTFNAPECSFDEDAKQQVIREAYSPLKDAGIDCDDGCTVGVQYCNVIHTEMILDNRAAKMGHCRYSQSLIDCQIAVCPALTDDDKKVLSDSIMAPIKDAGIDCSPCKMGRDDCTDKFTAMATDGRAEKLGVCKFNTQLIDCVLAACDYTDAEKQTVVDKQLDKIKDFAPDCEYNL